MLFDLIPLPSQGERLGEGVYDQMTQSAFTLPHYPPRTAIMRKIICILALCVAVIIPIPGQTAEGIEITPEMSGHLKKLGGYLNAVKSIQSDFVQISSTGDSAKGTLLLSRPKSLRIEYTPPTPILIVANGEYLSYVDTELDQVQHIPVDSTPAAFLLREDFDFESDELIITGFERASKAVRVSMVQRADPLAGELTLVFAEDPMVLRQWSIVDAQGTATHVTLINARFDFPIPEDRFDVDLKALDSDR